MAKRLPNKFTKTSICQIFRLAALAIIAFSHDDDEMPIMKLFVFKQEGAVVHIMRGSIGEYKNSYELGHWPTDFLFVFVVFLLFFGGGAM